MTYDVTLNGKVYEVKVERGEAILVNVSDAAAPVAAAPAAVAPVAAPVAAPAPSANLSGEVVSSPLPGTIIKVNVKVGDDVKKNQSLIVLEAMKMENEVVAPRDGKIAAIAVEKGAKVDTGSPLLSLA